MHKVFIKGTFIQVEEDCEEQQPVLRSQTTSELSKYKSAVQAEYVSDGLSEEDVSSPAQVSKDSETHECRARSRLSTSATTFTSLSELLSEEASPTGELAGSEASPTGEDPLEEVSQAEQQQETEPGRDARPQGQHCQEDGEVSSAGAHVGIPFAAPAPGHATQPSAEMPAWPHAAATGMPMPLYAANFYPFACMPMLLGHEQPAAWTEPSAGKLQAPTELSAPPRKHQQAARQPTSAAPAGGAPAEHAMTTVMLRNIPNNYTRSMLKELLDSEGFAGRYDFLYMPRDYKTQAALGFAFVNLLTHEDGVRMNEHLHGFRRWAIPSAKTCSVGWSGREQQGLQANVERYRNSSVMHESVPEECKPLILVGGRPVNFPAASRKLWPPHENYGVRANRR